MREVEDDQIGESIAKAVRVATSTTAVLAQRLAQQERDRANDQREAALETARRDTDRTAALVAAARADLARVRDSTWWDSVETDPEQLAQAWHTARDLAPYDRHIAAAAEHMRSEARRRWDVDLAAAGSTDPGTITKREAAPDRAGLADAAALGAAQQADTQTEADRARGEAQLDEEAAELHRDRARGATTLAHEARAGTAEPDTQEEREAAEDAANHHAAADQEGRRADNHEGAYDSQERRAALAERAIAASPDVPAEAVGARVRASEAQAEPASAATKKPKQKTRRPRRAAGATRARQSQLER